MQYTTLPHTGIAISQIVLGCWALGGGYTWGDQDDKTSIETVDAALDVGINCFDTAEYYGKGQSESVLGRALSGKRQKAVVISKIWVENMARDTVVAACENSLKRLKTDYLDVYMIHWPNREVPLSETLEGMAALKESGKVRALGVCNFGSLDLSEACEVADIVADQLPYSLLFRAIEYDVLPTCIEKNVPVMAYSTLAQGLLTGKFRSDSDVDDERARIRFYSKERPGTSHNEPGYEKQVFEAINQLRSTCEMLRIPMAHAAIGWVLQQEGVSAALVGARTPQQARENVQYLERALNTETYCELGNATMALKVAMGPNPDMWRSESRFR